MWIALITSVLKLFGGEFSKWADKKRQLDEAALNSKLKQIEAKGELAVYIAKSEVEWDLKWAEGAQTSWKDEFLLIMWAIPMIGLFIPWLRPYVQEGFTYLKAYSPDAPQWYMSGWAVIFSAVFGTRAAMRLMMPGKLPDLIEQMGKVEDDIPDSITDVIHKTIKDKFNNHQGNKQ